ncbi:HIT family protein [Parasphingorhabdus sp.]|uniref:HIT family protein n=1 Tax=Parasphingorhabdus sp. TaxID=2709688 RepID=UPI0032667139
MNSTINKFGYPATLIREYDNWVVLLRPAQVTLGSLIVAAKSVETDFGDLPAEHFSELKIVTADISRVLGALINHAKLNWLMLMMVDPHVHFHLIPRYDGKRDYDGLSLPDTAWPGPPNLGDAVALSEEQISKLGRWLGAEFES